jgi:hypothetical protein
VDPKEGTAKDWRYTRSKDSSLVYAIALGWPGSDTGATLDSLIPSRLAPGSVTLLAHKAGAYAPVAFTQDAKGLHLKLPAAAPFAADAYVFRLSKAVQQPSRTVSAGNWIEAEDFAQQVGIQAGKDTTAQAGSAVGWIENQDWVAHLGLDLGGGFTGFQARVASATSGGGLEIRLDSLGGALVGTCAVPGTGGWAKWTTVSCPVVPVAGVHSVYLRATGGGSFLYNLDAFRFTGGKPVSIRPRTKAAASGPRAKGALGSLPFDLLRVDGRH